MKVQSLDIPDVKLITPDVFRDSRGYFMESFNLKNFYAEFSFRDFVQDNESLSEYGVLRGLHFQTPYHAQAKLMRVVMGEVYDVAVDLRSDSSSFGKHVAVRLNGEKKQMLYVPRGFAHGFLVLSEKALFTYKVDAYYHPESEMSLNWQDPDLKIKWPIDEQKVILSGKDLSAKCLKVMPHYKQEEWEG